MEFLGASISASAEESHYEVCLVNERHTVPQVVALTQGAINYNLRALFFLNKDLKTINVTRGGKYIRATTKAGQISIADGIKENNIVFYHCFFVSGEAKLPSHTGVDLSGWELVFPVEVGKMKLGSGPTRDRLVQELNRPGDFDILALFLDFTTRDNVTFSYALQTQEPQKVSPGTDAFAPTGILNVHTYPYKEPKTGTTVYGLTTAGDRNVLLFILGSTAVAKPATSLSWKGNLAMAGSDGTLGISYDIMWDRFLLRKDLALLNDVNVVMSSYMRINYFKLLPDEKVGFRPDFSFDYGINQSEAHGDDSYAWPLNDKASWFWRLRKTETKTASCAEKWFGTLEVASTNIVQCNGNTRFEWDMNIASKDGKIEYAFVRMIFGVRWTLNFAFHVDDDGKLYATVDLPEESYVVDGYIKSFKNFDGKEIADDLKQAIRKTKDEFLPVFRKGCLPRLNKDIARVHQFALPGHGTFLYKNPIWGIHGDLLVDLKYLQ
ncbi:hypothetical protein CCM_09499 [Cordyceps militaris CM01]|uniref:Uncharacterized protein n=1 Tax=Cordyceps militaris (strain CM01) TaxID=983644 RepID=G3JUS6_CORMM|nr:uncharacterized protein CCM_09499 [Cordyceps militaris CM01]EGX87876.1 hypothetical protein CCM_09499 [Cordyceps militaris CM01]